MNRTRAEAYLLLGTIGLFVVFLAYNYLPGVSGVARGDFLMCWAIFTAILLHVYATRR